MKKALLVILIIAVIGFVIFFTKKPNIQKEVNTENRPSEKTPQENPTFPIESTTLNPSQQKAFNSTTPIIFEKSAGLNISFKGVLGAAQNPGSTVYLNGGSLGTVEGHGVIQGSFSPDNKYFQFSTISNCGAGCYKSSIYVIDIANKKLDIVLPPKSKSEYNGNNKDVTVSPYIEFSNWSNGNLNVTFYFIGENKKTGVMYRLSPKESWQYALLTKAYTLL